MCGCVEAFEDFDEANVLGEVGVLDGLVLNVEIVLT